MADEKKKVLAVDDENDVLVILKTALAEEYEVYTAGNGIDAIAIAEDEKPDLVILDMMMPMMDGFETLAEMREKPGLDTVPVIFLTGVSDKDKIRKALDMGTAYYLVKPFDYMELMEKAALAISDRKA